jgi:hypothetical protein
MPWRRRKKADSGDATDQNPMVGLRLQALELDPSSVSFEPTDELPRVFGAVMDTGYPAATVTLVGLVDGTTSLYTTSTFGIIGGGGHESVARETRVFLETLEGQLDEFGPDLGSKPPAEGAVIIHALTYDGRRSVTASENDLGGEKHTLSPVFHAAHRVISALRMIQQER